MAIKGKQDTVDMRGQRIEADFIDLYGEAWDDLRFPATALNPPGAVSDPDVEATSGLLLFDDAGVEAIFALAQMPHSWKAGSAIRPHVHWQKTTSAGGDVAWRCRYKLAPIGEVMDADWTDMGIITSPAAGTPDTDTADMHLITPFGSIDMTGYTLSVCILFEISRVGSNAGDTYAADARLLEFDVHYQRDTFGSQEEFEKEDRD